jgi:hypothetical protein
MSNQPNSESNVANEETWSNSEMTCPDPGDLPVLGFLQLCADRRFHKCIQQKFQTDAGLSSPEAYWIHADAGGTPKMECQTTAPDYCYYKKGVRKMGWSAHGNGCGGFGEHVPDDVIQHELNVIARRRAADYPNTTHYIYFATIGAGKDAGQAVVYCMKCEPESKS